MKLSRECVRAFLVSIDLSSQAAAQRSGPKVWTLLDQVVLGLDKDVQLRRDMSLLEPDWQSRQATEKPEFRRPSKQVVTVTVVTSAVRAQVAAQCIFHGVTERVVPDLATDVWMTCSHNRWASMKTLWQLSSKMEEMVNGHTPGQDFAVHISAETKQMLQEEFGHIRAIMILPHTTRFLQPCDGS